jgi:L-amino acid N-acyltransferase YncA
MKPFCSIRTADVNDAEVMLGIYRPFVLETAISFETETPSLEEFQKRITEISENFPWLVLEQEGKLIAYAYASPFKSRCAYSWSVESTVYVHKDFQRKGLGKQLYLELIDRLKEQGVVNIIGGIALPNNASVGLHESLGFKQVAQFKDVGFKLGKWWDVGYWQLQLQKPNMPEPLRKIRCK